MEVVVFSKQILRGDLEAMEELKLQQRTCAILISDSIREMIEKDNLTVDEVELEKSTIHALNDKLAELNKELEILEEQIFLNYTNKFAITASRPADPGKKFPHINTID